MPLAISHIRSITRIYVFAIAVVLCAFVTNNVYADTLEVSSASRLFNINENTISLLEDKESKLTYEQALTAPGYKLIDTKIPNLGISNSTSWLRFSVKNNADYIPYIVLEQPLIDQGEIYVFSQSGKLIYSDTINKSLPFNSRKIADPNYIFKTAALPDSVVQVLIKLRSAMQMVVPITVGEERTIVEYTRERELLFSIFSGIVIVMSLYNLFVYISVRDKSYLLYVVYILLVGITQTTLPGFTFKYLWPNSPWLALQGPTIFSSIASIAAIEFIKNFLQTKKHTPKLHWGLIIFEGLFLVSVVMSLTGNRLDGFKIMQLVTGIASLYALFISYKIYRMNYRPARFFLLSWTLLLLGAVVFVLKDFGAVPYNTVTIFALQISSVVEIVLLSFALADKINILRQERQAAVEENARIVREQNVMLEAKVTERTHELKEANDDLSQALIDLKEAEMQLVESEKMASLGQLTAGIAHEINNPINFVTSNIKPLKRDVEMVIQMLTQVEEISLSEHSLDDKKKQINELKQDYDFDYLKTEIDYLLNGIADGSSRTSEIVKGLRVFSRLDEDDLKLANMNEGIDSTLVIVNNQIEKTEIRKEYGNIPDIECYPGKLNQVFLNILSNGLYAIKDRFKGEKGGIFTITTSANDTSVFISFKDNGTGMTEDTQKKLFEPFFTTKDVGEGTGLGLSIAYNTIVKHNGTVTVNSVMGEGSEFIIELPIIHHEVKPK